MTTSDDWETKDFDAPSAMAQTALRSAMAGNWDDEDREDSGEVQESWEALDDSDEGETENKPAAAATTTTPPPGKRRTLKQALAARKEQEEAEAAKQAAIAAAKEQALAAASSETAEQRRRREAQMVLDADLENAQDLFGGLAVSAATASPDAPLLQALQNPRSKADFDALAKLLGERLAGLQGSTHYPSFCEALVRSVCDPLDVIDVTKVGSAVTALANEKRREAKAGGKKKKTAPAGPKMGAKSARYDMGDFGGAMSNNDTEFLTGGQGSNAGQYDVYDDFM